MKPKTKGGIKNALETTVLCTAGIAGQYISASLGGHELAQAATAFYFIKATEKALHFREEQKYNIEGKQQTWKEVLQPSIDYFFLTTTAVLPQRATEYAFQLYDRFLS